MTKANGISTLSDRDFRVIKFLFRFKVATTLALHYKFFETSSLIYAYHRLCALEKSRFITSVATPRGGHNVWTLSKKGFVALQEIWPQLKDCGFASENIVHDLLSSAAHIGEFLKTTPGHVELFTEQELRRYDKQYFPKWVPSSYRHRPDGYWKVTKEDKEFVIALEVELSPKVKSKYLGYDDFYRDYPMVGNIIWITGTANLADYIKRTITQARGEEKSRHSFILLDHYLQKQWQAEIVTGPLKGRTLAKIFSISKINTGEMLTPCLFLDTRKAPIRTPAYQIPDIRRFIY